MGNILKKRMRYIVPFFYGDQNSSTKDIVRRLSGKVDAYGGRWEHVSIKQGQQDVYQYILNSFNDQNINLESNIGDCFGYVLDSPVVSLNYCNANKIYQFDITTFGMILFSTGVGFIWYEISDIIDEAGNPMEEDLIVFQARFKELAFRRNFKYFKLQGKDVDFCLGDRIATMLRVIDEKIEYCPDRYNPCDYENAPVLIPDKAILYNYVAFDETINKKEKNSYSFCLTRGYKLSYKRPKHIKRSFYRPFRNVDWYVTKEGAGCYVTVEEVNKQFFLNHFNNRIMGDYFLIFILALNQNYSLQKFASTLSSQLSANPAHYMANEVYVDLTGNGALDYNIFLNMEQLVRKFMTEIDVFLVKNVRTSISHIQHQDDFFHYTLGVLDVERDIECLLRGVSTLQRLMADAKIQYEARTKEIGANQDLVKELEMMRVEKEKLVKEVSYDALTGLHSKAAWMTMSEELLQEAKENQKYIYVCSIDMNGLKYMNDNFGHEKGDVALKALGEIIQNSIPSSAHAFRFGGDEFTVLAIVDSDSNVPNEIADAFERNMKTYNEEHDMPAEVAMSYGWVVQAASEATNISDLYKQADDKMYQMKVARDKHRRS